MQNAWPSTPGDRSPCFEHVLTRLPLLALLLHLPLALCCRSIKYMLFNSFFKSEVELWPSHRFRGSLEILNADSTAWVLHVIVWYSASSGLFLSLFFTIWLGIMKHVCIWKQGALDEDLVDRLQAVSVYLKQTYGYQLELLWTRMRHRFWATLPCCVPIDIDNRGWSKSIGFRKCLGSTQNGRTTTSS